MNNPDIKKRAAKPLAAEEKPAAGGEDLERIRDILFGRQTQAIESRLRSLEALTREETSTLRSETAKRLASLELYVKGEITAVSERLRAETEERSRGIRHVSREIREALEAMEKRITAASAQTEEELRLLREQVLHDSQSLRDEIHASAGNGEPAPGSLPH